MTDTRAIATNEDPVCGMQVDLDQARMSGLTRTHEGREFGFCGRGCLLEFGDDPEKYLDPAFKPEM